MNNIANLFTNAKLRKILGKYKNILTNYITFALGMENKVAELLCIYAQQYETKAFLDGDPSCFMHQVKGSYNQETTAFVASSLSYGSRAQFLPKISWMLDRAEGDIYEWVKQGSFETDFRDDEMGSFYRLYSYRTMNTFLRALQKLLVEYESLGTFVKESSNDGLSAVSSLCEWFAAEVCCRRSHPGRSKRYEISLQTSLYVLALDGSFRFACRLRFMEQIYRSSHPYHSS